MLRIHFLNVGHGDCVIIEFIDNNRVAIVDINRSSEMDDNSIEELVEHSLTQVESSYSSLFKMGVYRTSELLKKAGYEIELQDPLTYLTEKSISNIFRFISTHPHMDHLSGLKAMFDKMKPANIWILENNFGQDLSKLSESQKLDWQRYKKFRDTGERKIDNVTIVRPAEGDSNDFWQQDGITILAPNSELLKLAKDKDNRNIMSYVILITHGVHKIVLGGDAEEDTWDYLYENYQEELKDVTILKASHHGRDSGYHQKSVKLMNPSYVVVSVGKKPSSDASNKYKQYCENVWSTRWKGNITFELKSNGEGTYHFQYDR